MDMKTILGVVAGLAVAAGAFYFFGGTAQAPVTGEQAFNWTISETETNAEGTPHAEVSLNGRVIGTFAGNCSEIKDTSWELLAGEQSGVICWWAGGGTEIGVFANEAGGYDVMKGELDEGSAEVAGTRGNFKVLFLL